ncbi:MAG: YidC/Oxa1 family membrane protein insertase [Ruminococcus sp.]|nr:YidC/Oxa1 family membrane protein insertase [Ruminococcus sp.]
MIGLYDIIGRPLGFLMRIINSFFSNYAVSIIIFTIVTKLILLPFNYSMQKSSARQTLLAPKLEKLKKSYANNPTKFQEEQQKLFQEEGVNPAASCLPSLIQMLLLFGVIDVVYKPLTHILGFSKNIIQSANEIAETTTGNLRNELIVMQRLNELSDKFKLLEGDFFNKVSEFRENFTFFGADLGKTPTLHPEAWTKEAIVLAIIPFLAGLAQLVSSLYTQMHQKKMNPNMQGQGCMTIMFVTMPLLSVIWGFNLPAGVGFYWIWSALISTLVTFALNQYFSPERIKVINEKEKAKAKAYAEKHPEKKTFMQRMLEQQQALENEQNSARRTANGDKISRSEMNKINREQLREARKRMAEKYGDSYDDNDDED